MECNSVGGPRPLSSSPYSSATSASKRTPEDEKISEHASKKLKTEENSNGGNLSLDGRITNENSGNEKIYGSFEEFKKEFNENKSGSIKSLRNQDQEFIQAVRQDLEFNSITIRFSFTEENAEEGHGSKEEIQVVEALKINRDVVAFYCGYFKSMDSFKESQQNELTLIDFPFEIDLFKEAIDFCYGLTISYLNSEKKTQDFERSMNLLELAEYLGNSELIFKIYNHYQEKIPLNKLILIFEESKKYKNLKIKNFLIKYFVDLSSREKFIKVPDQYLTPSAITVKSIVNEHTKMCFSFSSGTIEDLRSALEKTPCLKNLILENCDKILFHQIGDLCREVLSKLPYLENLAIRDYLFNGEEHENKDDDHVACLELDDLLRILEIHCKKLKTLELTDFDNVNNDALSIFEYGIQNSSVQTLIIPKFSLPLFDSLMILYIYFPNLKEIKYSQKPLFCDANLEPEKKFECFNETDMRLEYSFEKEFDDDSGCLTIRLVEETEKTREQRINIHYVPVEAEH